MGKTDRVILIKNAVETLGYFSEQIALELEHAGIDTYFIDYDYLAETIEFLPKFAVRGKTVLLTFNFIGLSREEIFLDESGHYIWDKYDIRYVNILVDHPLYYHSKLVQPLSGIKLCCIDREHVKYIKRFYPGMKVRFLPIAGNVKADIHMDFLGEDRISCGVKYRDYDAVWNYEEKLIPYEKRKYDLIFTANYVPLTNLFRKLETVGPEYQRFYRGIIDELIENPAAAVDAVMEQHITEEIGEVTDQEKRSAMSGMLFIDLCVRTYFRGEIVRQLVDNDIRVHVMGADWEQLPCRKPSNIIKISGQAGSAACVDAVRNAKISLNIMPWFKDGAHDRIFTAMLQKTAALTDDSRYLRKEFTDGEDLVFFSLEGRKYLPDLVHMLLNHEAYAARIAENGYERAYRDHTWKERAHTLMKIMDA